MLRSGIAVLLAYLSLLLPAAADAVPVVLDQQARERGASLAGHLEVFYDASGSLTHEQVRSTDVAARFKPIAGYFNGGFPEGGAWWLRFSLDATAGASAEWWLQLSVPYVDFVDVWLPQRSEGGYAPFEHRAFGGLRPVDARDLPWSLSVLELRGFPVDGPHWVWIRLAGHRTVSLAGQVLPLQVLGDSYQRTMFRIASVIGMMLMMAVVCLMLGWSLPDRTFLWYSAYLGSSALLFLCSENILSALMLPEHPLIAVRVHNVAMCVSLFAAIVFAHSLLELRRQFPHTAVVFRTLAGVALLCCGVALAGYYGAIAPAINLLRLLFAVLIVVLCAILVWRGAPSAWPNFVGYSVYALVGILHFAKNLDWLPYNMLTQYSYLFGVVVHMLAIFLSLGLRVRGREKQALADSLLAGVRLEARVAERTRELQEEVEKRQQAQARLQEAMQEQRNFLSMVSHEFRTPLSIIGASTELMADERLAGGRQDTQREVAKISRAKQRMLGLVETLLADEWLQSSTIQLHCRDLDLGELLRDSCDEHAEISGREVRFDAGGAALSVHADERLLHIVFDNLIENAIKYSPSGTAIEVAARREAGDILVSVRDHGNGFDPAELDLVFQRFFRSKQALRKPGIGLGMYMVRRIAALHGGSVQAGNAARGGAEVTVRLPGVASGRQITQEKQETRRATSVPEIKIKS